MWEEHLVAVERMQQKLEYRFNTPELLIQALTHRSFVNEQRDEGFQDNERLEFLGDAVLDLVVSHVIMDCFPEFPEGDLSKLRASIVNETQLALMATSRLDLGEYLLLGRGEENTGGREKSSILADAYEALIAALYLDGGLPPVFRLVSEHFVGKLIEVQLEGFDRDYKTQLQEHAQIQYHQTPRYSVMREEGPDHAKEFEVAVSIQGVFYGVGQGRSKKEAEQQAALSTLKMLIRGSGR